MEHAHVVVTGGAGFVGSHLCERLLADRHRVTCLDNLLTGAPANVAHLMEHPAFTFTRCDLTEFVHVPGDVDVVLHFARSAWRRRRTPASCSPVRRRSTATRRSIHSPSRTGATSTRWVRAACTTRPN